MFSGIFKKVIIFSAAAMILMLYSCPNDEMRDLVEIKVSDPVAESFRINSGAPTSCCEVILNSHVTKEEDQLEMRFKNAGDDWTGWMEYKETKEWTLPEGNGIKTVYAEYKDQGDHIVSMVNTIFIDTEPPEVLDFFIWGTGIES